MLDAHLTSRSFIAAERFTAADISVGYSLFLANQICGLPLPERVQVYFETLQTRPSWQKVIAIVNGGAILGHGSDGIVLSRAA
jgi:glutathione S-transferase